MNQHTSTTELARKADSEFSLWIDGMFHRVISALDSLLFHNFNFCWSTSIFPSGVNVPPEAGGDSSQSGLKVGRQAGAWGLGPGTRCSGWLQGGGSAGSSLRPPAVGWRKGARPDNHAALPRCSCHCHGRNHRRRPGQKRLIKYWTHVFQRFNPLKWFGLKLLLFQYGSTLKASFLHQYFPQSVETQTFGAGWTRQALLLAELRGLGHRPGGIRRGDRPGTFSREAELGPLTHTISVNLVCVQLWFMKCFSDIHKPTTAAINLFFFSSWSHFHRFSFL